MNSAYAPPSTPPQCRPAPRRPSGDRLFGRDTPRQRAGFPAQLRDAIFMVELERIPVYLVRALHLRSVSLSASAPPEAVEVPVMGVAGSEGRNKEAIPPGAKVSSPYWPLSYPPHVQNIAGSRAAGCGACSTSRVKVMGLPSCSSVKSSVSPIRINR